MLKVGLTGNIGSGKTTVAGVFNILGIPIFHADQVSKEFLKEPEVIREIVDRVGSGILNPDHSICRKTLAMIVFKNPEALRNLNNILHPRVAEAFRNWLQRQDSAYILQEAAILYESGMAGEFNKIIHVSCPKEIAVSRVMKRDAVDGNSVLQRMQFQIPDEKKAAMADFVIVNDGTSLVVPQVLHIHSLLLPNGNNPYIC